MNKIKRVKEIICRDTKDIYKSDALTKEYTNNLKSQNVKSINSSLLDPSASYWNNLMFYHKSEDNKESPKKKQKLK